MQASLGCLADLFMARACLPAIATMQLTTGIPILHHAGMRGCVNTIPPFACATRVMQQTCGEVSWHKQQSLLLSKAWFSWSLSHWTCWVLGSLLQAYSSNSIHVECMAFACRHVANRCSLQSSLPMHHSSYPQSLVSMGMLSSTPLHPRIRLRIRLTTPAPAAGSTGVLVSMFAFSLPVPCLCCVTACMTSAYSVKVCYGYASCLQVSNASCSSPVATLQLCHSFTFFVLSCMNMAVVCKS